MRTVKNTSRFSRRLVLGNREMEIGKQKMDTIVSENRDVVYRLANREL